jgi:hypothetical protein
MPRLQLFGGPQDGYEKRLSNVDHPKIYYAISPQDEEVIRNTAGMKAKAALREQLSVLAYRYRETVSKSGAGLEFQYERDPSHDKTPVVPGADGEKG